jgi:Uncharacterized conserved protein (some members contain a von Willebrand factor type A (vWA) domain)
MRLSLPVPTVFRVGWKVWWRDYIQRLRPIDQGLITLRQNRVYVLPTKRGFVFLFTVGLMLLTSLNYAISLGFIITFLWLGVIAATLIQTFRQLWGLKVAPISAGHAFAGGQVEFTVMVEAGRENRQRLMLSLGEGEEESLALQSNQVHSFILKRQSLRRGYLSMGRLKIMTEAPLGLWHAWSYIHFPLKALIFPVPEIAPPPLPQSASQQHGQAPIGAIGNDDLAGLREYQYGDPIQRVAWKAVARGAGWFSKAFEGGSGRQHVALDFSQLPMALDTETRLSRLTAWVLICDREGLPFSLALPGTTLQLGKGVAHTDDALTMLALFPGYANDTFSEAARS